MSARDWFGVGVRLLAVWLLMDAAGYVASWFEYEFWMERPRLTPAENVIASRYLIYAVVDFALALYFLTMTERLVSLTYGRLPSTDADVPPS